MSGTRVGATLGVRAAAMSIVVGPRTGRTGTARPSGGDPHRSAVPGLDPE